MWLELERHDGEKRFVNIALVRYVRPTDNGCVLIFDDDQNLSVDIEYKLLVAQISNLRDHMRG